jgi:hypothetical protein
MAYEITSMLGGRTFTLIVSTAKEALAELTDMPARRHQDATVRDLNGNTIDPIDLRALALRECADQSKDG